MQNPSVEAPKKPFPQPSSYDQHPPSSLPLPPCGFLAAQIQAFPVARANQKLLDVPAYYVVLYRPDPFPVLLPYLPVSVYLFISRDVSDYVVFHDVFQVSHFFPGLTC